MSFAVAIGRLGLFSQMRTGLWRSTHDGFAALNVYKDASKAPVEKPDSEYPEWLWKVTEPGETKEELLREAQIHYAKGGFDEVFDKMQESRLKRLFKLDNTARIKENNERRRGGRVI